MSINDEIVAVKQIRLDGDAVIQKLKALKPSRERALAITKFQEGVMWSGMDLKRIREENPDSVSEPNPYPNSKDPTNTIIEPTYGGIKL